MNFYFFLQVFDWLMVRLLHLKAQFTQNPPYCGQFVSYTLAESCF